MPPAPLRASLLTIGLGLTALLAASVRSPAEEAPWQNDMVSKSAREICARATKTPIPSADEPTAPEQASLKNCSSRDLYYGVKVPQDYAAARKCAYVERDAKKNGDFTWEIAGPAVLMMIYGNGDGVAKNLDLALKFACEAGGAPMEIDGRLVHIESLERSPTGKDLQGCERSNSAHLPICQGVLDICDDITSGAMGGVCAALHSDIEAQKTSAEFARTTRKFTPEQAALFARLEATASKYFEAHASNEIDLSGTARGEFFIEERDAMRQAFRGDVTAFENDAAPGEAAGSYAAADKKLNDVYAATLKRNFYGTINKNGVRDTQRAWLPYRDAWVAFAASRYPKVTADAVKAFLTRERIGVLEKIGR